MASGGTLPVAVDGESASLFDLPDIEGFREKLACLSKTTDKLLKNINKASIRRKARRKSAGGEKEVMKDKPASSSRSPKFYREGDENEYGRKNENVTDKNKSAKTSRDREDFTSEADYFCEYEICSKFSLTPTVQQNQHDRETGSGTDVRKIKVRKTHHTDDCPVHVGNGGNSHKRAKSATVGMHGKEPNEQVIQQNSDKNRVTAGACRGQEYGKREVRQQVAQKLLYYGDCQRNNRRMSTRRQRCQPQSARGRLQEKYPYENNSCDNLTNRYSAGSLVSSVTASLGSKPSLVQLNRLKRGKPRYIKRPIILSPPRANPRPHLCQCRVPLLAECGKIYHHVHECKCRTKIATYRSDKQMINIQRPKTECSPQRGNQDDEYSLANSYENRCDPMAYSRDLDSNPSTLSCYIDRKPARAASSCHCCACLMNVKSSETSTDTKLGLASIQKPCDAKAPLQGRCLELPHILSAISCSPYKPDRQTKRCLCPICGLKHLPKNVASNLNPRNSNMCAASPSPSNVPSCQSQRSLKFSLNNACTCDQCMLKRRVPHSSCASSKRSSVCSGLQDGRNMEKKSSCVYFKGFESAEPRVRASVSETSRCSARYSTPQPTYTKGPSVGKCSCCKCPGKSKGQERLQSRLYDTDEMSELCRCKTPAYSLSARSSNQSQAPQIKMSVATIYSSRSLVVSGSKPTLCCCGKKGAVGNISGVPYSEPVKVEQAMPVIPARAASEASSYHSVKYKCAERPLTSQPSPPAKSGGICNLCGAMQGSDGVCTCCPTTPRPPVMQPAQGTCICPMCRCKYSPTAVRVRTSHSAACLCAECICPDESDAYSHQFTPSGQVYRPPSANSFVSQTIDKCPCPDCHKYVAKEGGYHVKRGSRGLEESSRSKRDFEESSRSRRSVESRGSGRQHRSSQSRHSSRSRRSDRSGKSSQKRSSRDRESSSTGRSSRGKGEILRASRGSDSCSCPKVCLCESELSDDGVAGKGKTSETEGKTSETERALSGCEYDFTKSKGSGEALNDQRSLGSKTPSKAPSSTTTNKITLKSEKSLKEKVGREAPYKTSSGAASGQQEFKEREKIEEALKDEDKRGDKTLSKTSSRAVSGREEDFVRVEKASTQTVEAKKSPSITSVVVSEYDEGSTKFHDSEANLNEVKTLLKTRCRTELGHEGDGVKFHESESYIEEEIGSNISAGAISAREQDFAKSHKSDDAITAKKSGETNVEGNEEVAQSEKDESNISRNTSEQDDLSRSIAGRETDIARSDEAKDVFDENATDKAFEKEDVDAKSEEKQSDAEVNEQSGKEAEKSQKQEEGELPGIEKDNESKSMGGAQSKGNDKDSVSKGSSPLERDKPAKVCTEKKDSSFYSKCSCSQYEGISISNREPCVCSLCFRGAESEGSRISDPCSCFSQSATCKHSSDLSSSTVCSSSQSGSWEGSDSLVEVPAPKRQPSLSGECTDESKDEYVTDAVLPEEPCQVAAEPKAESVCLEPDVKIRESCLTTDETIVKSAYLEASQMESEVLCPSEKTEAEDALEQGNAVSMEMGAASSVKAVSPSCPFSPPASSCIVTSYEEQQEMVAEQEIKCDRSDHAQLEGARSDQEKSNEDKLKVDENCSEKHETGSQLIVAKVTSDKSDNGSQVIVAKPKVDEKKQVPAGVCPNDCGCPDCPFLSSKPWLDDSQSIPTKAPKTLPPKIPAFEVPCQPPNGSPDLSCSEALDQIRNILCGAKVSNRGGNVRCSCPARNRGRPNFTSTATQRCTCCREPGAQQRKEGTGGFGLASLLPSICAAKENRVMTTVARLGSTCMDKAAKYGCEGGNDELLGVETGVSSFFGFLFSEIKNIKDMLNCGLQKIGGANDYSPCGPGPAPPYSEPPPSSQSRCLQPACCVTPSCCMRAPCCCASAAICIIGVHSVGVKSLLVTWKVNFLGGIVGFEVYVDDCLKSRSFSPTRTSALAYGVDLSRKHTITVVAVMDQMCGSVNVVPAEGSYCYSPTSMGRGPACSCCA